MKFLFGILTSLTILGAPALAAVNGPCSGTSDTPGYYGICISTSSCRANGGTYVNNRCPNDPNNIKCCTIAGCADSSSYCGWTSRHCSGKFRTGLCPGGNNYKCCDH
ncbi:conserved hypothetical protein [Histoplasma capsulatum G186AR]|uniref:Uncharacterized protein n=4 Tax=Ajellomyces capsulatus TaxID=5037 RepID=C0NS72_AJECG|nr:uncharacterized protein HCBG_06002 [Histoplasma capsulatum G186AR]EER41595.1 conserved hypothetical protein [Histoplasma capsulatum H143]KAG5300105.1 hypothetical protein I7I52_10642 [Histoplasma capsulatum]QSS57704.1 hypothetical protein I7I53_11976 [Histoplasma capsulatum var. duboisii H88]EEH05738.1 conserved hypothetical protein [Histoplasma capsulatum G186AR]QSS67266.1 hypothetical protein I7I50_06285 [Histoplasma capsulatum G186AR]